MHHMFRNLASTTLAILLFAISVSEAKRPRGRASVNGRFTASQEEPVQVGAPFQQEGWETQTTENGKVTWAAGRPGRMALKLDAGCGLKTSCTLAKGLHHLTAVNIYGWNGEGEAPVMLSIEDAESGEVYSSSPARFSSASVAVMRYPIMALGTRGPGDVAVDGDITTDWSCEVNSPGQRPWLVVDLGERYEVGGLRLTPSPKKDGSCVKTFEIFHSRGSYNWLPLGAGVFQKPGTRPVTVMFEEPSTERYFKVLCKSSLDGGNRASLAELEFLGTDGKPLPRKPWGPSVRRLYFAIDPGVADAVNERQVKLVVSNRSRKSAVVNEVVMLAYPARGSIVDVGLLGFKSAYWAEEACMAVVELRPGKSAAQAGLRVGDLIMGVNRIPLQPNDTKPTVGWFMRSHESTLGRAVVAALLDGSRKVELTVLRGADTVSVPMTLPETPAFTDTFPFDCPMADEMRRDMATFSADYLEKRGAPRSARGIIPSCYSFCNVLGMRDARYGPLLQKVAHELVKSGRNGIGLNAWFNGAAGVMLSEYYLATGDAAVLPWITETLAYFPQTADFSKWGHAIYGHHPGSLPYGGKSLVAPSIAMLSFDALGAYRIGVKTTTWDTIGAYVMSGWSDPGRGGHGGQGYGHGPSRRQAWFRTGGAGLAAKLRGDDRIANGTALYQIDHHWAMRNNHAYGAQGAAWGLLGLAASDPEGFRSVMQQYAWHFALSWEPGFGLRYSTYHMGCSYMDPVVIINGGYGAVFSVVNKGLHMTGATDKNWLAVPPKTYASEVLITRDQLGTVSFRPHLPIAELRYTLDGTEPAKDSSLYEEPISLPDGGLVAVRAFDEAGEAGPVARKAYGTSRRGWTISRRLPKHLFRFAFDGDPYTYYETPRTTQWCRNVPHHLHLQFPTDVPLLGLRIAPRLDNVRSCAIVKCSLRRYDAATKTTTPLAEAEIRGGGDILLKHPITTDSIVFSVDSTAGNWPWSSFAEVYPITPDPEMYWEPEDHGVRIKAHDGYPITYATDGTIPGADSARYDGKLIKCGVDSRIIARVVAENGWMGKPVVYAPDRLMLLNLKRTYYEYAGRSPVIKELTPLETIGVSTVNCAGTKRKGNIALVFTGTIVALADTRATLTVTTHADNVVLYVEGKPVWDNRRDRKRRPRGGVTTVALKRGSHAFRLEHTHGKSAATLGFKMEW